MENNGIQLSSPWVNFYRELEALFGDDPEIKIEYDEDQNIDFYVDNEAKAEALLELLPGTRTFGNVTVFVNVIPFNTRRTIYCNIYETAFSGNPAFAYTVNSTKLPIQYVVFKNKVVQYFNDALDDAHGVRSTLYQDIAKDVFGELNGVYFCTDLADKDTGMPLGEWP